MGEEGEKRGINSMSQGDMSLGSSLRNKQE